MLFGHTEEKRTFTFAALNSQLDCSVIVGVALGINGLYCRCVVDTYGALQRNKKKKEAVQNKPRR